MPRSDLIETKQSSNDGASGEGGFMDGGMDVGF